MDNGTVRTVIVAGAAVVISVIVGLILLAIIRDGPNEGIIVTALLSIPSVLISGGSALLGQHLANSANSSIQSSVANAIPPMLNTQKTDSPSQV